VWQVRLRALAGAAGAAVLVWSVLFRIRLVSTDMGAGSFPITRLRCGLWSWSAAASGWPLPPCSVDSHRGPGPTWVVVAAVVVLLSFAGPFTGTRCR